MGKIKAGPGVNNATESCLLALGRWSKPRYEAGRMMNLFRAGAAKLSGHLLLLLLGLAVGGCAASSHQRVSHGTLRTLQSRAVEASRLGVNLRDGELDVQVDHTHGGRPTVTVPMKWHHGLPAMDGQINGRPVLLIMDTGSQGCLVLDADTAVRAKVDTLRHSPDRFRLEGAFGSEPAIVGRAREVKVGAWNIQGLPCLIRTHRSLTGGGFFREQITLNIWGMALLHQACTYLTLDHKRDQITFGFDGSYQPQRGNEVWKVPLRFRHGLPYVQIGNGQAKWEALLDSGANSPLEITQEVAQRGNLLASARTLPGQRFGVGVADGDALDTLQRVVVPKLFGLGLTMRDVPAFIVRDEPKVGSGLLAHYRATIDFRRNLLWLEVPRQ
ncbi:aspartyl protease [Roseimicrobium gellanilyticum]|uniref:Aspartyl protease n=2 Tax=Roseimicrobium gellanilyticum TaxID=748857 RepID=A0A366HMV1_9BACT|nr:aspartyl protease [Roseimicrobium gellanilyticum]